MRRRLLWAFLVALLVTGFAAVARADDTDAVPPRPPAAPALPDVPPLYEQYQPWAYTYDAFSFDPATHQTLIVINAINGFKAWTVRLAIRAMEYALDFNAGSQLLQPATDAMQTLRGYLWDGNGGILVGGGLVLAGGLALLLAISGRRSSGSWPVLGSAGAALLVALLLLAVGPQWLQACSDLARPLGIAGLDAVAAPLLPEPQAKGKAPDGKPSDLLVQLAGAQIWDTHVYQPWLFGEFGSLESAKRFSDAAGNPGGAILGQLGTGRLNSYLTLDPSVRNQYLPWWSEDYLIRRAGLVMASTLSAMLLSGVLLVLGGAIVIYQLLLVWLLATAPIWLLLAIWLPGGIRLGRWGLERALGALAYLVVLPLLLGVTLAFCLALASANQALGWAGIAFLQGLLGVLLWRYRRLPLQALGRVAVTTFERQQQRVERTTQRTAVGSAVGTAGAAPEAAPALAALPVLRSIADPGVRLAAERVPAPTAFAGGAPVVIERSSELPPPSQEPQQQQMQQEVRILERRLEQMRDGNGSPAVVQQAAGSGRDPRSRSAAPGVTVLPLDVQRRLMRSVPAGGGPQPPGA